MARVEVGRKWKERGKKEGWSEEESSMQKKKPPREDGSMSVMQDSADKRQGLPPLPPLLLNIYIYTRPQSSFHFFLLTFNTLNVTPSFATHHPNPLAQFLIFLSGTPAPPPLPAFPPNTFPPVSRAARTISAPPTSGSPRSRRKSQRAYWRVNLWVWSERRRVRTRV